MSTVTAVYIGGMLLVMSTFSYIWRRRKAASIAIEPWFPEHTTRDTYISLLQADPPASELQLKSSLLRRAMTNVERAIKLGEDRPALNSLVQKGAVGDGLWNSFLKAQKELQYEMMEVTREAETFKKDWGQTIFHTANEMVQHENHKKIAEQIKELKEKEERDFKKREEREKVEEIENEKREKIKLEKERKKAEEELLKMEESDKKKGKDSKGKSKKK